MSFLHDSNSIEILDDIDHLLFLCDRLSSRLLQVNSYVDEVKQRWLKKRHSLESEPNISRIAVQKVSKCSQVLLNVAEKLAVVELQTESLYNLQSTLANVVPTAVEKRELQSAEHTTTRTPSSNLQSSHVTKNETVTVGHVTPRPLPSNTGRLLNEQHVSFSPQMSFHVATNSSTNLLTPKNVATLVQEKPIVKQRLEQLPSQLQSAFHRPNQKDIQSNQQKLPQSQNLLNSQTSDISSQQKSIQANPTNTYQQQSTNNIMLQSSRPLIDSNVNANSNTKVRVKMQRIKNNVVWHNADIPIIDHPSAFFVGNQDPRVAEQFMKMSIEMNNYYNKPVNTTAPLQNPSIGDFCVTRFSEDNQWYRARVVLIQDESILIVFIDYGNSESKPVNEIYPIQESLTRLPAMAVACTLAESFPHDDNFWTPEATQVFSQLVKNRIVEVQFQQSIGQQWPLHFVKVILDGQSIAQHPKLATYITPVQNEQIALHFNDKLTSMEYILYNVAVNESDIYTDILA